MQWRVRWRVLLSTRLSCVLGVAVRIEHVHVMVVGVVATAVKREEAVPLSFVHLLH